ncbi:hypothetical protein ACLB2K_068581 [Fragaria x ananassa]
MAIREGLRLLYTLQVSNVDIETGCLKATYDIEKNVNLEFATVRDCRTVSGDFWLCGPVLWCNLGLLTQGALLNKIVKLSLQSDAARSTIERKAKENEGVTNMDMEWADKTMQLCATTFIGFRFVSSFWRQSKRISMAGSGFVQTLFIADASLFVDDAEAHEKYHRQEELEASAEKIEHEAATNASQT